jgi:glycosyltransferase involved in cell wall biosynthesis
VRILVLSTAIPFPPISGGKLRTFHLLRALSRRHELTLVGFTYGDVPDQPPYPLRVVPVPWTPPPLYRQMHGADPVRAQWAADRLADETADPWCVNWAESKTFDGALRDLQCDQFDLVLFEGTPMARFSDRLPRETTRILDFMDVYSRMARRQADERHAAAAEAERTRRFERQAAQRCKLCLAVSDEEATAARDLLDIERLEVVPNGVDTTYFSATEDEPEHGSLLFTGTMSYRPNAEAIEVFVRQVLPRIIERMPAAKLHVVGAAPPPQIKALAGPHVSVHGYVPDMRPFHRRAAVVVVPLRRGGGTKLKVLEAAAMGKAIVTTSVGVEGLPFEPDQDLIVADSDTQFAAAALRLANDAGLRQALGKRARRIALHFDWKNIEDRICGIVEALDEQSCPARN